MKPPSSCLMALTLLVAIQNSYGYKCYICSWSPASPNRTDICTRKNFNQDAVKVFDQCTHGCESVSVYDSNGELENFYRNCVLKGKKVDNDCKEETTAGMKKTVCRCDSDLCNAAAPGAGSAILVTLAAAAVITGLAWHG